MMAQDVERIIEILLVEDNPGDVRMTVEALREAGIPHHLHAVEDGEQAMLFLRRQGEYAESPLIDLILLDLNLPGKSGRDVLAEIMPSHYLSRIPVIVLTSSQAEADIMKAYDLHASSYVVKPMDFRQLVEVMKSIRQFWQSIERVRPVHKQI